MFEDYYMPEFDTDYFNSPAFQQAIAAAVEQYSPPPVEPVYYAPPPAPTYDYQSTAGIGGIDQYMVDDYGLIGGAPDRFTASQISAEQLAAERYAADQAAQQAEAQAAAQAAADRAAAERYAAEQAAAAQQAEAQRVAAEQAAAAAEAQRVAAAQELAARVEAERVAAEQAAAAAAAYQRQQTELNDKREQAAQAAAQRAAQERALAEQAAAQAAAEAQAAAQAQAQAAAQAEAQRVAAAQAQAQADEQARVQAAQQAEAQRAADAQAAQRAAEVQAEAQRVSVAQQAAAEQARMQAEAAAAVAPAPTPTPEPVYTPAVEPFRGIGGRGEYEGDVYAAQIPETYAPAPAPAPETVYTPAPEPVRGIGRSDGEGYYEPEIVYTQTAEPMTVEAAPVAGIGSPAVAAAESAPSVIEAAAAAPAAAQSSTGLQVINANDYSPSETDLQTMGMSRDQWNEMMASFATMDLGSLNFGTNFGITNPDYTDKFKVFTAPKSNKGNPTSTVAAKDNTFNVIENQPVRLVDMSTGKVVFQGTGYDAAQKAIDLAAGLTKAGGNKADWEIQTGQFKNPGSGDLQFGDAFKTVANEKKNTSILNQALDIIGDAALGFIIGGPVGAAIAAGASAAGINVSDIAYPIIAASVLGPVGFAATAGAAALGSAVSSVVQGRSIEETLIRAGVTGLTAGVMSGTDIGGTVSNAVEGVLKDIGIESQVGNILSGIGGSGTVDAVTGEIIVNAATDAASAAAAAAVASGAVGSAVSSAIVDAVKEVVPDYQPSPETETLLNQVDEAATTVAEVAADPTIVVTANPVSTVLSGTNPIVETAAGIAGGFSNVGDLVDSPELQEKIAEEKARVEEPKEEIVVTATPEPEIIPVPETAGIGGIVPVEVPPSAVAPEEPIVVEATRPVEPPPAEPAPEVAGIGGAIEPIVVTATKPVEPPPEEPTPEVAGIGGAVEPIVVTATKPVEPPAEEPEVAGIGTPGFIDPVTGDIVVSKPQPEAVTKEEDLPIGPVLPDLGIPEVPTPDPTLTDEKSTFEKIKDVTDVVSTVLPIVGGVVGGGGDDTVTTAPDTSKITFRPSTLRPTIPGGAGGIGGVGGRYPYTPQTYGRRGGDQETEYLFFTRDPVTGAPIAETAVAPVVPGKKEGGEIEDDMVKHLVEYHKNGGHQGPGQVKGIGSGQEDKIPAWLSDGEYVWSAQDVADLGDGSTDEGVRRLDKMRQMVRHQAGRKDVKKIAKPQKGIDRMLKAVGGLV